MKTGFGSELVKIAIKTGEEGTLNAVVFEAKRPFFFSLIEQSSHSDPQNINKG